MRIEFDGEVILWDARDDSSWFFVTLPEELSDDIKELPRPPRGFGSLRVRARIGSTHWSTSIFPGSKATCCRSRGRCGMPRAWRSEWSRPSNWS